MPSLTFSPAHQGDDGMGAFSHSAWPASGGAWADGAIYPTDVGKSQAGATYYDDQSFIRWDTSAIPDEATITGAQLLLAPTAAAAVPGDAYRLVGAFYDFGGEPTVVGDYAAFPNGGPSIFAPVALGAISPGTGLTLALTALGGISKSGYTGVRLGLEDKAANAAPTGSNYVVFADYETATAGALAARLVVTYTMPGEVELPPVATGADPADALQVGLYALLAGDSELTALADVYDGPPENAEPPWLVIGEITSLPDLVHGTKGRETSATFHGWARGDSMAPVNTIGARLVALLQHRHAALDAVVTGHKVWRIEHEFTQTLDDPEPHLRHRVDRFRIWTFQSA